MAREKKGFIEGHEESVGKGQFANMPTDVKMQMYPKVGLTMNENIDDSMTDIDDIGNESESKRKKYLSNQK